MLQSTIKIASLAAAIAVTGCATPNVRYGSFTQDAPRSSLNPHADTYMLSKTMLSVSRKPIGEDGLQESFDVTLRRIEDPARSFAITPWNRYGVTTRVSLAKVDNTQLVQSVAVSVEDKRKEYIGQAFKLLGTLSGIAPQGAPAADVAPRFPAEIDTLDWLTKSNCLRRSCPKMQVLDAATNGAGATLLVSDVPPDAMDVNAVVGDLSKAGGVFIVASCRQATLRVVPAGSDDDLVTHFSLADPRYVQLIGLPAKGQIVAHSECGYSVVPENVELQSDLDVADSFFEELFKFKKAYDEAQDDDSAEDGEGSE